MRRFAASSSKMWISTLFAIVAGASVISPDALLSGGSSSKSAAAQPHVQAQVPLSSIKEEIPVEVNDEFGHGRIGTAAEGHVQKDSVQSKDRGSKVVVEEVGPSETRTNHEQEYDPSAPHMSDIVWESEVHFFTIFVFK